MATAQLLPPFPNGWYCLAFSRELDAGGLRPLHFMGQELVLFRTAAGQTCAMEAYCPHLGAHLGYGGAVQGEVVRCPFHGFCYDTQGNCTFIPYGTKVPPKAKARVWPVREAHGLNLAYHDADGQAPRWEVPNLALDGWSPLLSKTWRLRGHPQETTENSVDLGHFSAIHGYTSVASLKGLFSDGPYLNLRYAMSRPGGLLGRPVRAEFEIHVYGLGYSLVEVVVPQYDLRSRLFVLATPIDGEQICLRVALSLHQATRPGRLHPLLGVAPRALVNPLLARAVFAGFVHDVQQDFVIWEHKRYVQPPILAEGDGPVGKYRQWAKQFYCSADAARV